MLKNILKLDGAQELSQKQQQSINGGGGGTCWEECNYTTHCCGAFSNYKCEVCD